MEVEFETGVAHVTEVGPVAAVADGRRSADLEQHIGGLAVEVVEATGETIVEQLELKAGIEVGVGFPGDVLGTLLAPLECDLIVVVHDVVGVGIQVVTDVVVTLRTDGDLVLEGVHPGNVDII